eukprot:6186550-Pleurochrysis_carterae.AAC.9
MMVPGRRLGRRLGRTDTPLFASGAAAPRPCPRTCRQTGGARLAVPCRPCGGGGDAHGLRAALAHKKRVCLWLRRYMRTPVEPLANCVMFDRCHVA